MSFAHFLKSARLAKGLTQMELSKLAGLGRSAIGMYESGKREPSFELLSTLSGILDVTPGYLLNGSKNAQDDKKVEENSANATKTNNSWELLSQLFNDDPETLNILKHGRLTANGISLNDSIYPMTDDDKLLLKGLIKKIIKEVKNGAGRVEIHRKD